MQKSCFYLLFKVHIYSILNKYIPKKEGFQVPPFSIFKIL
nr:MAG TPA: hypothetical protein [Caudoviricetes sp.]